MYKTCIVKTPCAEMVDGLSSAELGRPVHSLALKQHAEYVKALEMAGCRVITLPPDPEFPDSVFVEDTALMLDHSAVITRPGAESRQGETAAIRKLLNELGFSLEEIRAPGTLDAGDVLEVGDHFFIGLSSRTNREGAGQLGKILEKHGKTSGMIEIEDILHLKTAVAWLGDDTLLVSGALKNLKAFKPYQKIEVDDSEAYAANCIMVNRRLLIPAGYPRITERLSSEGYQLIALDTTEFKKLDGGLSCLSLRF